MSKTTSAVRTDESFLSQGGNPEAAIDPIRPILAIEKMRSCLRSFSETELEALEDELDFYTFTGVAGPYVQRLLSYI